LLTFYEKDCLETWGKRDQRDHETSASKRLRFYATLASVIPFGLVVGAFILLSLLITAYTRTVGWAAVGLTGLFGLMGFVIMLIESPCVGDAIKRCFCC
jgi:hypothetical protein